MDTKIIIGIVIVVVIAIGFIYYLTSTQLSGITHPVYQRVVEVDVEESMPKILKKAEKDWKDEETEVKQIASSSKPAHVRQDVLHSLNTETSSDSQ